MLSAQVSALPAGSFLQPYSRSGEYTDCYSVALDFDVTLSEFMEAFYTTGVFKSERYILAKVMNLPSTDEEAHAVAQGSAHQFAAWMVEKRDSIQAILAAGRTRSWFMVQSAASSGSGHTVLYFGSAIVSNGQGRMGWQFRLLLSFHKLYSRILLSATARRLARGQQ